MSVEPLEGNCVTIRFGKHTAMEWGRVWLAELEEDDVEIHLRRERGLALRPKHQLSNNSVKEPLLKRFRVGRVLAIPLGYTKQMLHDIWGLDLIIWCLAMGLAFACPNFSVQDHASSVSSSSSMVSLVLRGLSWPLIWALHLPPLLAARIIVASMVVISLKLFRLEVGRDKPISWGRSFGVACCFEYGFLASFSWTEAQVFSLVGVFLMYKFWHAERFTRMTFIGIFTCMLLHVDAGLLLFVIVVDCIIRRRLRVMWLLWCVVVFSIMTWIFFVLPFDSLMHDRLILLPAAWRSQRVALDWITVEELAPIVGLAAMGIVVQPQLRRYLYVGAAYQVLIWLRGDPILLSLWLMPLINLACAGAIEALWLRRRRWATVIIVGLLLCLGVVVSLRRFLADKCSI